MISKGLARAIITNAPVGSLGSITGSFQKMFVVTLTTQYGSTIFGEMGFCEGIGL